MKDPRPLSVRYNELKIKCVSDLESTKKSLSQLKKEAEKAQSEEEKLFFQRWVQLLTPQVSVIEKSVSQIKSWITNTKPDSELTYKRLVKNEDLNSTHTLFGGRMMEWCDEAAALYAFKHMHTQDIVTLKVSEMIFKHPVLLGDILEFHASTAKVGRTSFELDLGVYQYSVGKDSVKTKVLECSLTFVAVDKNKKPMEWVK